MDPVFLIPITALCIPIVAILTAHQRHMAEIKARISGGLSQEVRAELNEIKSQLSDLRDTTTRFDMTFDAALSRLEQRMDSVEQRQATTTTLSGGVSSSEPTITVGRSAGI